MTTNIKSIAENILKDSKILTVETKAIKVVVPPVEIEIPQYKIDQIIRDFFKGMKSELDKGESIEIRGFGSFKLHVKKDHLLINPMTRKTKKADTWRVVKFTQSRSWKGKSNL